MGRDWLLRLGRGGDWLLRLGRGGGDWLLRLGHGEGLAAEAGPWGGGTGC